MSDEIVESPVVVESGSDMAYDPFDEVVEEGDFVEASSEEVEDSSEQEEPKEEENEPEESEVGEESEGNEDDENEDSEEKSEEDGEKEPSEDDKEPATDLSKQIEEGSLEVEIGEEKVTLKDLKNDYIGQKEIARRFTEYDVKSKQLEADTNEINGYINEFATILKSGDSVGAMSYFGEFAGVPPYMIKEQLVAALRPEIIRREQMTATEIQNEYLSHQNEYLQETRESDLKRQEHSQALEEAKNHVNDLRKTHGIDEQTWTEAETELRKTLQEGEELTPELVAGAVEYSRMYDQAESVVKTSSEQLDNQEEWIEQLVNVKEKYPDFTDEDLKEVLENALQTVKKSSSEQKLAKKLEKKSKPISKQTKQTSPAQDEDVDPELDDWL